MKIIEDSVEEVKPPTNQLVTSISSNSLISDLSNSTSSISSNTQTITTNEDESKIYHQLDGHLKQSMVGESSNFKIDSSLSNSSIPSTISTNSNEILPLFKEQLQSINDDTNNLKNIEKLKHENFKKRVLGILIVGAVTILMSAISELNQHILSNGFNQPLVLVLYNTVFLALAIPIEMVVLWFEKRKKIKQINNEKLNNISTGINNNSNDEIDQDLENQSIFKYYKNEFFKSTFTAKRFFVVTLLMCILYVALNWIWSKGLPLTEVSTSTALYQSATVWVFIFSIFILKDKPTILKCITIVIFIGGVIGITLADRASSDVDSKYPDAILGDILMIVSASMWALYEVMTTKLVGDTKRTVVNSFIGGIGVISVLIGVPLVLIVHYSGFEPFELPDWKTFGMLTLSAGVAFFLNYLINFGLSITSPLMIRSGELMTIPCTLVFDIIFKHIKFPLIAIPGFSLIVIGFVLSLYVENKHMKEKALHKIEQQQLEQQSKQQQDQLQYTQEEEETYQQQKMAI